MGFDGLMWIHCHMNTGQCKFALWSFFSVKEVYGKRDLRVFYYYFYFRGAQFAESNYDGILGLTFSKSFYDQPSVVQRCDVSYAAQKSYTTGDLTTFDVTMPSLGITFTDVEADEPSKSEIFSLAFSTRKSVGLFETFNLVFYLFW